MRKFCKIFKNIFIVSIVHLSRRLESVKDLKNRIQEEKDKQEKIVNRMREQSEVVVNLRYALWNIGDILHQVVKNKRVVTVNYPTEELKLPLLTFDTFTMRAFPPEMYEEDCKFFALMIVVSHCNLRCMYVRS